MVGLERKSINWNIIDEKPDKYQQEAIKSENKSSLIIAGAGSGKTTTVIGRILYLLYKNETIPNDTTQFVSLWSVIFLVPC